MLPNKFIPTVSSIFITSLLLTYTFAYCEEKEKWQHSVKQFIALVGGSSSASDDAKFTIIKHNNLDYALSLPYHKVEVNKIFEIIVATDGSTVYEYRKRKLNQDLKCLKMKKEDAIDKSVAFSKNIPVLEFLNLPISENMYSIKLVFQGSDSVTLDDCYWQIEKDFEYDGIPCRQSKFFCSISACSGEITFLTYLPRIIPRPKGPTELTRKDAITIARKFILNEKDTLHIENVEVPDIVEDLLYVIAPEYPYPHDLPSIFFMVPPEALKTSYCWEVPFIHLKRNTKWRGVVWVNVNGGNINGIIPSYHGSMKD